MSITLPRRVSSLARASKPFRPGAKLINLEAFGFVTDLSGADVHGYNQNSDVLVQQTVDGVDYNQMWREFQDTIALQNAERTAIVSFLSYSVTEPYDQVTQLSGAKFERQTEYGEPRGVRQQPSNFWLGYTLDDFDIAIRYTWKFLINATAAQVEALHGAVLQADNELQFAGILDALFNPTNRSATINSQPYNVYALYNGDGTVPPSYKSNTFDGTHTHYMTSGATTITPGDLDDLMEQLRHHGYSAVNGSQQVIAVNSKEGKVIRGFRIDNGATYDFIPAQGEALPLILEPGEQISGTRTASTYRGLHAIGTYGEAIIVEDDNFPPSYAVIVATGGRDNLSNPVGIREHSNPALRGLKLIKGPDSDYPLTDSFYMRAFGTGIRQRGGAAVMQITTSGTYTKPSTYLY